MKKILLFLLISLTLTSLIFAAQGEARAEVQNRGITAGSYISSNGEELQIQTENGVRLRVRDIEAHSELNMTQQRDQNRTRINATLSNGRNAEIKVMPDAASETAIARLRLRVCSEENNCTIQLKEVGSNEQVRAAYEVRAQKEARVLGLFRARMQVQAQVDAETGEVIQSRKPWWAFLAAE